MEFNKCMLIDLIKSMPDDTSFMITTKISENSSRYEEKLVIITDYVVGHLDIVRV